MTDLEFIKNYLNRYKKSLFESDVSSQMIAMKQKMLEVKKTWVKAETPSKKSDFLPHNLKNKK